MSTPFAKIHPMMATAAAAVVVVSLVGTAAILGWLPSSQSNQAPGLDTSMPATPPATGTGAAGSPATSSAAASSTAANAPAAPKTATPSRPRAVAQSPSPASPAPGAAMPPQSAAAPMPPPAPAICADCGKVEGVRTVEQAAKPSGVGVLAGAAIGGLLGNQVGGGSGKTLATVAGAVGGGYAGNEIEKRTRKSVTYEVDVRMENGERKSFAYEAQPNWRAGDPVRVVNGTLAPR